MGRAGWGGGAGGGGRRFGRASSHAEDYSFVMCPDNSQEGMRRLLVGDRNGKRRQRWGAYLKAHNVPVLMTFVQDTRWDAGIQSSKWIAKHLGALRDWLAKEEEAVLLPFITRRMGGWGMIMVLLGVRLDKMSS